MTRASSRRALCALARAHGIQTGYLGTDGRRHSSSDEVLIGVLGALGAELERPEQAEASQRLLEARRARRIVEPVVAHREGEALSATLLLPEEVEPARVWVALRTEEGAVIRRQLNELGVARTASLAVDGARLVSRRLRFPVHNLLPGYHRLEVEGPGIGVSTFVISAPRRSPEPDRAWGTFIPLHALRTASDWGVGSFADLSRLGAWVGELGGGFVGTLPLSAVFDDVPFADPSPYMPASRLAWNEAYIDVEHVPDLAGCPEARAFVDSTVLHRQLEGLRRARLADSKVVVDIKRRALEAMARSVCSRRSPRRAGLEAFVRDRPELVAYARFRATCELRGRPFWEWPIRDQMSPSTHVPGEAHAGLPVSLEDLHGPTLTNLYAQWVAGEQLTAARTAGTGLYLDMPVGVHPAGFDPWWEPESFASGVTGGAPPDSFFSNGQVWGFPPLLPDGIREQEYRYVISALRHTMQHASMVRVDHVMGLHRMYWVPSGASGREGAYVRYKADELHAVLCLEAHRSQTAVVGEDLGTVPGTVRRALVRDGLSRSFVFEFASNRDDPFPTPPEDSLASLSTHDLPPFAAYWRGLDIEDRCKRGEIDPALAESMVEERASWRRAVLERLDTLPSTDRTVLSDPDRGDPSDPDSPVVSDPDQLFSSDNATRRVLEGCLAYLAASPARLVMADLEDLWLETDPQNRPGTGSEAGNFLRRAQRTLEEIQWDPDAAQVLANVNRLRHITGTGGIR